MGADKHRNSVTKQTDTRQNGIEWLQSFIKLQHQNQINMYKTDLKSFPTCCQTSKSLCTQST